MATTPDESSPSPRPKKVFLTADDLPADLRAMLNSVGNNSDTYVALNHLERNLLLMLAVSMDSAAQGQLKIAMDSMQLAQLYAHLLDASGGTMVALVAKLDPQQRIQKLTHTHTATSNEDPTR